MLPTLGANHDIGYFSVLQRKGRKTPKMKFTAERLQMCVHFFEMPVIKNGQA